MTRSDAAQGASLALEQLSKRYRAERVVDRIDLTIPGGAFFSILGPSGSGKTTTLMMVAGFVAADEGHILVDDADISRTPPERRGFRMVFQNYAVFPHLNVFENVAFPLRTRRVPKAEITARVEAALDLVRLRPLADRFSRQLSGGQQQRVAIARAIVFRPRVVLMDEPLGALDKNLRYAMQTEIKEIQNRLGMTVLYVTHDQEEAMNLSDRIAIMDHGRIAQEGAPRAVYESPANAFVARFLGEANLVPGRIIHTGFDGAMLETESGARLRAGMTGLAVGTQATLFVRPEKLSLHPPEEAPGPATNGVTGKLRRQAFLGNIIRSVVEIAPGTELTIDLPNRGGGSILAPGTVVGAQWPVVDSHILSD